MQQFVLFVLGDVSSLFPTISDGICRCTQLIWILGAQEFVLLCRDDLRGSSTRCSLKIMCFNQVGGAKYGGCQEQV